MTYIPTKTEMKEFIRLRQELCHDYHHAVYMEKIEQAKMYESEITRLDSLIHLLTPQ